jgi:hypothetical protein
MFLSSTSSVAVFRVVVVPFTVRSPATTTLESAVRIPVTSSVPAMSILSASLAPVTASSAMMYCIY